MDEKIRIDPNTPVIAGTWGTWRIVYTVGVRGIAVAGGLEVTYHRNLLPLFWIEGDWTTPQCENPTAPGYATVKTTGKAKAVLAIVPQPKFPDLPQTPSRCIQVTIEETHLLPGEELIIIFGDTSGGGQGMCAQHISQLGMEFSVLVDHDGNGHWTLLPDSPRLDILGGPATRLRAYTPSIVQPGEEFSLSIRPLDEYGHLATGFDSTFEITSNHPTSGLSTVTKQDIHNLHFETAGVHRFNILSGALQTESNPVLVNSKKPALKLFWGDVHGHSNLSDGLRSPDDYYQYARDISRLDFAVLTDHEPGFGPRGRELVADGQDPVNLWGISHMKAMAYHEPGRFVTFSGYEWTSGRYGHKCVYYLTDDQPVFSAWDPESDTPEKLYKVLRGRSAMVVTHHPAGGPAPAELSLIDPAREPLVEIYSCHGCSDAPGIGRPLWRLTEGRGFYVQEALNQGYHFGIIAGSDTHTSDPGNPLVKHPLFPHPHRVGIMAVYAKELTRQAIWEALWARRVYATTGERILLDFKIDGHSMGEDLTLRKPPLVHMTVAGTAPLAQVELIRNGQVIMSRLKPGLDLELDWQEDQVHVGYYYLRVTQEDGEMAWSSPIWVKFGEEGETSE